MCYSIIKVDWALTALWVIWIRSGYLILTFKFVMVRWALKHCLCSTRSVGTIQWAYRLIVLVNVIHVARYPFWDFQKSLSLFLKLLPAVKVNTKVTVIFYLIVLYKLWIILFFQSYRGMSVRTLHIQQVFKNEFHRLWGHILYITRWRRHLEHFFILKLNFKICLKSWPKNLSQTDGL